MSREDLLHVELRKFLKKNNFKLIAGQYPNGSDDELQHLTIKTGHEAPRVHHKNSFVPDLIAFSPKDNLILVIEIKPKRSLSDEEKLRTLLSEHCDLLKKALLEHPLIKNGDELLKKQINNAGISAGICFYFSNDNSLHLEKNFHYFLYTKEQQTFKVFAPNKEHG